MAEPTVPLIPLRHFFDNPERAGVQISPDGAKLSYLAPEEGRLNVWVRTIGENDDRCVTHDHTRGIPGYVWSRDGKKIIYIQDQGGNENYHVFVADLSAPDQEARDLTPFENVRVQILKRPHATPTKLLVMMNQRHPALFDVHRLDIETAEIELVAENPGDIAGWVIDLDGLVRGAVAQTATGDWDLRARDDETDDFRSLGVYSNEDEAIPFAFTADGKAMVVSTAKGAEFHRLCTVDIETAALTVVDEDDQSDLINAVFDDRDNRILAAVYLRDRVVVHPFDEQFAKDWTRWEQIHSGDPNITGHDEEWQKFIITYDDDRDPGATYLYDRTTGKAEFLWRSRPWLEPDQLAPMQPVTYSARDGLTVHAYLTTPVGMEAKGLPTVILVHGGPWARDAWGYDPEAQFLANRGYAVFQINYRGSSGYGKTFSHAAEHEFAGKMHDDLIDGVNHLVDQGIADPDRVAIYGGSYGGYATLVGVTFTPDVFAAAVSYCGPSSLITLINSFPEYFKPFMAGTWFKYVGDPSDPEVAKDLEARSPLFFIDKITTPLMVVQGANDVRVTKLESDQIVEALRDRGIDVEYICKDDEGHGFANPENKLELYAGMEQFFAKHLGGRTG